jgi:zinc protease
VRTITGLEPVLPKAQEIARGQTFFEDPLHYEVELRQTEAVTPDDVQRVARQYLTAGRVVLSMVPGGKLDMASKPAESYTNVTIAPEMAGHGGQHQ